MTRCGVVLHDSPIVPVSRLGDRSGAWRPVGLQALERLTGVEVRRRETHVHGDAAPRSAFSRACDMLSE